jgi:hypothetical protein
MSVKRKFIFAILISFLCILAFTPFVMVQAASKFDAVMSRWSKDVSYKEKGAIGAFNLRATYYSGEFLEALIQNEAEKNLWTADEMENYKYEMLKTLHFEEYIPFLLEFDNNGPSMHMAPFDKQVVLWVGNKKYVPVDYDKRFNFKLLGKRDGLIYFPRYDEKGKSVLEGVKTIRLSINGGIHGYVTSPTIDFFWDVVDDNPEKLYTGKAAARLELDRLIKRLEKLNDQKKELEGQLAEVEGELQQVQKRVEELQRQ